MAHAIMSRQDHIGITTRTHAPLGVCTQRSACVDMRGRGKPKPPERKRMGARGSESLSRPTTGIVCDASCLDFQSSIENDGYFHGVIEWQAKDLITGETIVKSGRYEEGNINLGEFLAIVGTLQYLQDKE